MFNKNPTLILSGIAELVRLVLPLLVLVGLVHLGDKELAGWIAIVGVVISFITTSVLRLQVTPNDTATQQIGIALKKDPTTTSVEDVKSIVKEQNS